MWDKRRYRKWYKGKNRQRKMRKQRRYNKSHRKEIASAMRRYCREHPIRILNTKLKTVYGIDLTEYRRLLKTQKNLCAICRKKCISYSRLSVDHNHITNKVRGLLCNNCNRGLGGFNDKINLMKRAITYLRKTRK